MAIINAASQPCKPPIIADVFGYVDTIEIFSPRRPTIELKNRVRDATGRRVWDQCINHFGWMLKVNQPSIETPAILDRDFTEKDSICRVHVALDFDPRPGVPREAVIELIQTMTHLRYRRDSDEQFEYFESLYAIKTKGRKTRVSKNTMFYPTRIGKLDGEFDKLHFEIRLEKKRAVIAAGIERPIDLLSLNPRLFVQKQLKIADHKPALHKIIKKAFRSNPDIPQTRILSLFNRMGVQTLTGFKRLFPIRAERLRPLEVLNIGSELEWVRKQGVNMKCAKLMALLHASRIRPPRHRVRPAHPGKTGIVSP
jgi:hypothetical protein